MAQRTLPNKSLLRNLAQRYFQGELSPEATEHMSSYWKEHTQYSEVELDDDGNPISLSGRHFGGCKWNGLRSRALDQLCVLTHLIRLPHKRELIRLRAVAARVCKSMGLDPTTDVFRQVCTLEVLQRQLPEEMRQKRMHVMVIGDGFGVLAALFKAVFPNSTIVMVDIGRTLIFQAYHCQKAYPNEVHELAESATDLNTVDFAYCPAENLKLLEGFNFDVAANVVSMHEMTERTVAMYFDFFRRNFEPNNLFYCCNRVHKVLPCGEASEFYNYPWQDDDRHLLDADCPWSEYFFSWGRAVNAPRVLGMRMPIIHPYDGKIAHRLSTLALAK